VNTPFFIRSLLAGTTSGTRFPNVPPVRASDPLQNRCRTRIVFEVYGLRDYRACVHRFLGASIRNPIPVESHEVPLRIEEND